MNQFPSPRESRSDPKTVRWMIAGAAVLVALLIIAIRYNGSQTSAMEAAFRGAAIHDLHQLQMALASASDREESAVMAATVEEANQDSEQAKSDTARAETQRKELELLLQRQGTQREKDLLGHFSASFAEPRG